MVAFVHSRRVDPMSEFTRRKKAAKAVIDRVIHGALRLVAAHPERQSIFEHLLHLVRSRTALLRPPGTGRRYETMFPTQIVCGLLALASHREDWLRPADDWLPSGAGPLPEFASLVQHLLAGYPVPLFMVSVWFWRADAEGRRRQDWYKHLGLGRNIRTADIPLPLTKRMAHEFTQAPDHYSVEKAMRWGQVRGLGGSKALAQTVVATRLGRSFEHEDFWRTVVHFFVNHPELDFAHVGPIVDYLHHQRFVPQDVFLEEGAIVDDPLQPNLSIKGRTPRSLLRQVAEWHARLRYRPEVADLRWWRSRIGEFRLIESDGQGQAERCWTIQELLSSGELVREGAAMRHCVASYARACASRKTSIWSMRCDSAGRRYRALTIEVDLPTKTIWQARRRNNALPTAKLRRIMEQWARQEGLRIEC
jgi:hypothetical protein